MDKPFAEWIADLGKTAHQKPARAGAFSRDGVKAGSFAGAIWFFVHGDIPLPTR
jgi:hypothetical protein